jgi:hypothetical protein
MFTFDIVSTVLVVVVLAGLMLILSAVGSALSRLPALIFVAFAFIVGVVLFVVVTQLAPVLSYIKLVGYFFFLFQQLAPFGLLLYGSVTITSAVSLIFLAEVFLAGGFVQGQLDERKSSQRLIRSSQ